MVVRFVIFAILFGLCWGSEWKEEQKMKLHFESAGDISNHLFSLFDNSTFLPTDLLAHTAKRMSRAAGNLRGKMGTAEAVESGFVVNYHYNLEFSGCDDADIVGVYAIATNTCYRNLYNYFTTLSCSEDGNTVTISTYFNDDCSDLKRIQVRTINQCNPVSEGGFYSLPNKVVCTKGDTKLPASFLLERLHGTSACDGDVIARGVRHDYCISTPNDFSMRYVTSQYKVWINQDPNSACDGPEEDNFGLSQLGTCTPNYLPYEFDRRLESKNSILTLGTDDDKGWNDDYVNDDDTIYWQIPAFYYDDDTLTGTSNDDDGVLVDKRASSLSHASHTLTDRLVTAGSIPPEIKPCILKGYVTVAGFDQAIYSDPTYVDGNNEIMTWVLKRFGKLRKRDTVTIIKASDPDSPIESSDGFNLEFQMDLPDYTMLNYGSPDVIVDGLQAMLQNFIDQGRLDGGIVHYGTKFALGNIGSSNVKKITFTSITSLEEAEPTSFPTTLPTTRPSSQPSDKPTTQPSARPSARPSSQPSARPSGQPSSQPTTQPTTQPTSSPSRLARKRRYRFERSVDKLA